MNQDPKDLSFRFFPLHAIFFAESQKAHKNELLYFIQEGSMNLDLLNSHLF